MECVVLSCESKVNHKWGSKGENPGIFKSLEKIITSIRYCIVGPFLTKHEGILALFQVGFNDRNESPSHFLRKLKSCWKQRNRKPLLRETLFALEPWFGRQRNSCQESHSHHKIVVAVRLRTSRILENLKLAMPYDDASYIFFCKPFHQGAHKQIMQKERRQETTKKQYIQIRKK